MKNSHQPDPIDALGAAYEKMYERAVENIEHLEDRGEDLIHRLVDEAREMAVELRELSEDDAELVAQYVRRDLSNAVQFLSEAGHELRDWLGFESALLEAETREQLKKVADPTTVELLRLKLSAETAPRQTGEITGPGTLVCDNCGEKLHFHRAGRIPPCPQCKATVFHRIA